MLGANDVDQGERAAREEGTAPDGGQVTEQDEALVLESQPHAMSGSGTDAGNPLGWELLQPGTQGLSR